jgi:intracellular multiplication protein IcmO
MMTKLSNPRGLENYEIQNNRLLSRDIRSLGERVFSVFGSRNFSAVLEIVCAITGFVYPQWFFSLFFLGFIAFIGYYIFNWKACLPFRLPKVEKRKDPHSPSAGHNFLNPAQGVIFLGNERGTGKELWLEKKDILTHLLLLGTTGSGKTESLISLAFNSLASGSGLFYIDPKAAPQLAVQIWQMARYLGRDDDYRVLNYATSRRSEDKTKRLSNTNNPFSFGSADALTQILASLMPPSEGVNSIFADKAMNLISGLMYALVDLRDQGLLQLSVGTIRDSLSALNCLKLLENKFLSVTSRDSLKAAILNCNYVPSRPLSEQSSFFEQYGYAQSYFGRALSNLTDTYGHIYGVEGGEVDYRDVVLNRRILLTLLPSMEKSPTELSGLGKITLSAIKTAASVGLGLNIEGAETDVLGSLPIHYKGTGPFMSIVDEYATIVTPGFEFLLTQGRGLGMATVVASQDYAGLVEADRKGAQQIVANTNVKIFMRLEEPEKTWQLLSGLTGEEPVMMTTGFRLEPGALGRGDYRDNFGAEAKMRPVAVLKDLMEQTEGEAHLIFKGNLVRGNMFYVAPNLKGAVLRIHRMLQMEDSI